MGRPNNDLVVVLEWAVNHNEVYKRVRAAVIKTARALPNLYKNGRPISEERSSIGL